MSRIFWRPSNMLYPVPAALISCMDEDGNVNLMTAAWIGTVCSDPVMLSVSIRPSRYSYDIIRRTGEFVVNLTTKRLAFAADYCGVVSGRDIKKDKTDKFEKLKLTKSPSKTVRPPGVAESPVCLECRVKQVLELGSHDMFIAEVTAVSVDDRYMDAHGRFDLAEAGLIAWSHGEYFELGRKLGKFGFSVRKKKAGKKHRK